MVCRGGRCGRVRRRVDVPHVTVTLGLSFFLLRGSGLAEKGPEAGLYHRMGGEASENQAKIRPARGGDVSVARSRCATHPLNLICCVSFQRSRCWSVQSFFCWACTTGVCSRTRRHARGVIHGPEEHTLCAAWQKHEKAVSKRWQGPALSVGVTHHVWSG